VAVPESLRGQLRLPVIGSPLFTGVHGNYLRSSIVKAGLDPDCSSIGLQPNTRLRSQNWTATSAGSSRERQ